MTRPHRNYTRTARRYKIQATIEVDVTDNFQTDGSNDRSGSTFTVAASEPQKVKNRNHNEGADYDSKQFTADILPSGVRKLESNNVDVSSGDYFYDNDGVKYRIESVDDETSDTIPLELMQMEEQTRE